MDPAAARREKAIAEARAELMAQWKVWSAHDLALWWDRWFGRTTHKGLVPIVRELASKAPPKPQ
jgi:hypothetical protein